MECASVMQSNAEYISTRKGGKKLLLDGYAYVMDRRRETLTYWRCERRGVCGGRIRMRGDTVDGEVTPHSHPPDFGRNLSLKTINGMKERAKQSEEITSNIIQICTNTLPPDAVGILPSKETLARMIRRQRVIPDANIITNVLRNTIRGESFLLHEATDLFVFSTARNLQLLVMNRHWFCDSTFDSTWIGYQLCTLHAFYDDGHSIPLVYAITPNRLQSTYESIFNAMKRANKDLNPLSVTIDFEKAAINSLKQCFPDADLWGCFFHFGQCLWREIQHLGLQTWYSDLSNAQIIKCFQALACVPVTEVAASFDLLVSTLNEETKTILSQFLKYFEFTWIGIVQDGQYSQLVFDVKMWNILERMTRGLPQMTHSLEGWHRGFEHRMGMTHPSLCRLISKLRIEQSAWEVTIEQLAAGIPLRESKTKYSQSDAKLQNLMINYSQYSTVAFLKAISHKI